MAQLELYYLPNCPFCKKVMQVIESLETDIAFYDISKDQERRDTLIRVGGKRQVPCLFIDGKPMYESDHIIDFLQSATE